MDAIAELPATTQLETPLAELLPAELIKASNPHRYKSEEARLNGIKGAKIKKLKRLERQQKAVNRELAPAKDSFMTKQRDTFRARLKQLDELMKHECESEEPDAAKLDRLASAMSKLADQERISDGRPLPGSRKPGVERAPKQTFSEPQ